MVKIYFLSEAKKKIKGRRKKNHTHKIRLAKKKKHLVDCHQFIWQIKCRVNTWQDTITLNPFMRCQLFRPNIFKFNYFVETIWIPLASARNNSILSIHYTSFNLDIGLHNRFNEFAHPSNTIKFRHYQC